MSIPKTVHYMSQKDMDREIKDLSFQALVICKQRDVWAMSCIESKITCKKCLQRLGLRK